MKLNTIGVVLATFNGEKFLNDQLDSLMNQTLLPDKILIVDDFSIDNTSEIATDWEKKYPKIISFLKGRRNVGYIKNFEKGISLCESTFIALCDQDDIWKPDKLEKCINGLLCKNNAGLCYHDAELIDYQGSSLGVTLKNFDNRFFPIENSFARNQIIAYWGSPIRGFSIVFDSKLKKYFLPVPGNKFCPHDWWLCAIAFFLFDPIYIDEPLVKYRIHDNQVSGPSSTFLKGTKFAVQKKITLDRFIKNINKEFFRIINIGTKYKKKFHDNKQKIDEMNESFDRLIFHLKTVEQIDQSEINKRIDLLTNGYYRHI